jgi:hypothetical protein
MKYSLRSLFIAVTLFAVLLGGRVEYLRRWADFHHREVEALGAKFTESHDLDERHRLFDAIWYHDAMEDRYRAAIYRPWTLVDHSEPTP